MKKTLLVLGLLSFSVLSFAQTTTKKTPTPEMQTLMMARQLADYGYVHKDAMSLANAAKIIAKGTKGMLEVTEKEADKKESNAQTKTQASQNTSKSAQTTIEPAKLIRDAKTFAGTNANLVAAVTEIENDIKAGATKGLTSGSTTKYYRIDANSTKTLTGRFRGGEYAKLIVDGDNDTDLDLYVYDENGNLMDSDTDNTDYCITEWTPKWTGEFKIVIKNRGSVYNNCVLMTN